MNNVTYISKRKFLGTYEEEEQRSRRRFDGPFLLGVTATIVAPQLVFCFFFGSFFALVFGACVLSGSGFGIRSYKRVNSQFVGLQLGASEQIPSEVEPRVKKIA